MSQLINMIRPTHITLCDPDHPFERIIQIGKDPWLRSLADFRLHTHHSRDASSEIFAGPSCDVRVTNDAYFLDGEFPGVRSKEDIILEMVESHTLCISTQVTRVDLAKEWGDLLTIDKQNDNCEIPSPDYSNEKKTQGSSVQKEPFAGACTWVNERHVGNLQRSFTFPADAELDSLTARLSDGVLKIMIRRGSHKTQNRRFFHID